ncbi:MAG: hypothetical protein SFY68_11560 [Candidatus Sumerlaeia bacterium]|nr:hypothetical protein [Candidatus Sumerlaeia bacterium]
MNYLLLLSTWLHVTCAALLIGGVFFLRFIIIKYGIRTKSLTPELKNLYISRYLHMAGMFLTVLTITGLYNLSVKSAAWKESVVEGTLAPHAIFGIKFLVFLLFIGLVVFTAVNKKLTDAGKSKLLLVQSLVGIGIIFLSAWLSNSY